MLPLRPKDKYITSPPTDHSGDDGTPPHWRTQKPHGTLPQQRQLAPPYPFAPDESSRERQCVLQKTDTQVTFPSLDTFIQAIALLFPQQIIPGRTESTSPTASPKPRQIIPGATESTLRNDPFQRPHVLSSGTKPRGCNSRRGQ